MRLGLIHELMKIDAHWLIFMRNLLNRNAAYGGGFCQRRRRLRVTWIFCSWQRGLNWRGGNIRNIVVNAAFLAAEDAGVITMAHPVNAAKREYQKMGKVCGKDEFGKYYV
ncbi:MAG: hypothetical protein ACP5PV_02735 [Methanothrix sp.]